MDLQDLEKRILRNGASEDRIGLSKEIKERIQLLSSYSWKVKINLSKLTGEQIWHILNKKLEKQEAKTRRLSNYLGGLTEEDESTGQNINSNLRSEQSQKPAIPDEFTLLRKRNIEEINPINNNEFQFDAEGEDDQLNAVAGDKEAEEQEFLEKEAQLEREMQEYFDQMEEDEMKKAMGEDDQLDEQDQPSEEGDDFDEIEALGEDGQEGFDFEKLQEKGDFDIEGIDDEEYERLLQAYNDDQDFTQNPEQENKNQNEAESGGLKEADFDDDDDEEDNQEDNIFEEMRERELQIDNQESKLLSSKPWQMKGEVRAFQRPKNALLDVNVDFEHGVELKQKKAPEVHQSIEEMIKQRILVEAFDDPKAVLIDHRLQNREVEDLNFERDKNSLASYYEEDYKRKMLGLPLESKEDKVKSEILKLFRELNHHLDYMTNLTFTPMPSHKTLGAEAAGKNIQVIQAEERVPITVRDVDQKTTKQSYEAKPKEFVGDNERTHEDNRRVRRIAKRRIRARIKKQRAKNLAKNLEYSGQSKMEYNLTEKARKAVEREHQTSSAGMTNMTKASQFFKILQEKKSRGGRTNAREEMDRKKRLKLQKEVKL